MCRKRGGYQYDPQPAAASCVAGRSTRGKRTKRSRFTDNTLAVTYRKDENGCSHEDPNQWQEESLNGKYLDEVWRKKQIDDGNEDFLLEINCILCGKDVRVLPTVEELSKL